MIIPLRQWIQSDQHYSTPQASPVDQLQGQSNEFLFKKIIVACGVVHLTNRLYRNNAISSPADLKGICSLDNFMVQISISPSATHANEMAIMNIVGVDMISPKASLRYLEPFDLNSNFLNERNDDGRDVKVEINGVHHPQQNNDLCDEKLLCHILGVLLYNLFSNGDSFPTPSLERLSISDGESDDNAEPMRKRSSQISAHNGGSCPQQTLQNTLGRSHSGAPTDSGQQATLTRPHYVTLLELGLPSSIHALVENLLECGWEQNSGFAYTSLEIACNDMQLLLVDPHRFLYENLLDVNKSSLQFRKDKLYGREKECSLLADSLGRVLSGDGATEALFIGGYSGSGKTKLVESVIVKVIAAGGFVVREKFDSMERDPYSIVLSVFNALCHSIKDQTTSQELQDLVVNLMVDFQSDFIWLATILPDIFVLCPVLRSSYADFQGTPQMNLTSIAFILQRFVKVIASICHPVMIFLDDLQWANSTSLELVQEVLINVMGSSVFFIGSYRENEVQSDHPILTMVNKLETSGISTSKIHLEGLSRVDLKSLVSDTLGLFPRLCDELSGCVFQNTQGNPFFVREFLQSLVNSNILQYSLRQKRWIWNSNQCQRISTNNLSVDVLHLLSLKMNALPDRVKLTLKTMSCFGSSVDEIVVRHLSTTPQYQDLNQCLERAVADGFMIKKGKKFRFMHDRVAEASNNLIEAHEKESFHYTIASLLLSVCVGDDLDAMAFIICDQFVMAQNVLDREQTGAEEIFGLFVKAGEKAFNLSQFPSSRSYFMIAEKLLPSDSWNDQYDLCLRLYFLRAKSSYSCGYTNEAKIALQNILDQGRSLEDKLEAYYLMVSILFACNEMGPAYAMGCQVISQLHEPMPDAVAFDDVERMVTQSSNKLNNLSDREVFELKEADRACLFTLKFYSIMCGLSFLIKPDVFPVFVCKGIDIALENGMSPAAVLILSQFAGMLCSLNAFKNVSMARRIGKLAMSFQARYDLTEQMPHLINSYHAFVAPYTEPMQSCLDMHLIGFDMGMSSGDMTVAFFHAIFYLRAAFFSGENLQKLVKKIDYYLKLAEKFGHLHSKVFLKLNRATFLAVIGEGDSLKDVDTSGFTPPQAKFHSQNSIIQSFWLGHTGRFEYQYKKHNQPVSLITYHHLMYLHVLNYCHHYRGKNQQRRVTVIRKALAEIKPLAENNPWNFLHQAHLLEALHFSIVEKRKEAKASFKAAIKKAHDSKFVHEEGLACEYAAFYYEELGDIEQSLVYFNQSKACYAKWGSQIKVDFIANQISRIDNK